MRARAARSCSDLSIVLMMCCSIAANVAFAAEPNSAHRYEVSGAATLTLDALVLQNDSLRLQGMLSPKAVTADVPAVQSGSGFQLSATLTTASLVCYNDTIFRDDFDGDGF